MRRGTGRRRRNPDALGPSQAAAPPLWSSHGAPRSGCTGPAVGGPGGGGGRSPGRVGDQDVDRARAAGHGHRIRRAGRAAGNRDAMWVALTGLPDEGDETTATWWSCPVTPRSSDPPTLAALVEHHRSTDAAATLLTAEIDDPTGYGRVVRGRDERWPGWSSTPTPPPRSWRSTRSTPPSTASVGACWLLRCGG